MSPLVPLVMFSWIPIVLNIFSRFPPQRAALIAFILAWLFLPMASFPLSGLPDYTKMSATCAGILLACMVYDSDRLAAFQFHPVDIPVLCWCLSPLCSSLTNGLGPYDGVSQSLNQTVTWGLPYLVGRIYFNDINGLNLLARGLFYGALAYIPFCLYETRMSPILHYKIYGFMHFSFAQAIRGGGYRPTVFMVHGLMVGMWMAMGTMLGIWGMYTGALKGKLRNVIMVIGLILAPVAVFMALGKTGDGSAMLVVEWKALIVSMSALVTTILVKSSGALGLMIAGLFILFASVRVKTSLLLIIILLVPPSYIITRSTGIWSGKNLTEFLAEKFSEERAASLQFRFDNETILVEKAMVRPTFGWGGWGRSRVYNEDGEDISITDGLWIIALGNRGLFGLGGLTLALILPIAYMLYLIPIRLWAHPDYALPAAMSLMLGLYMVDNLLNAMVNPVYMLVCGGLNGLVQTGLTPVTASGPIRQAPPPGLVHKTRVLTAPRPVEVTRPKGRRRRFQLGP